MYKKSLDVILKYLTSREKPFRRRTLAIGRLAQWLRRWIAGWRVPGSNLREFNFLKTLFHSKVHYFFSYYLWINAPFCIFLYFQHFIAPFSCSIDENFIWIDGNSPKNMSTFPSKWATIDPLFFERKFLIFSPMKIHSKRVVPLSAQKRVKRAKFHSFDLVCWHGYWTFVPICRLNSIFNLSTLICPSLFGATYFGHINQRSV